MTRYLPPQTIDRDSDWQIDLDLFTKSLDDETSFELTFNGYQPWIVPECMAYRSFDNSRHIFPVKTPDGTYVLRMLFRAYELMNAPDWPLVCKVTRFDTKTSTLLWEFTVRFTPRTTRMMALRTDPIPEQGVTRTEFNALEDRVGASEIDLDKIKVDYLDTHNRIGTLEQSDALRAEKISELQKGAEKLKSGQDSLESSLRTLIGRVSTGEQSLKDYITSNDSAIKTINTNLETYQKKNDSALNDLGDRMTKAESALSTVTNFLSTYHTSYSRLDISQTTWTNQYSYFRVPVSGTTDPNGNLVDNNDGTYLYKVPVDGHYMVVFSARLSDAPYLQTEYGIGVNRFESGGDDSKMNWSTIYYENWTGSVKRYCFNFVNNGYFDAGTLLAPLAYYNSYQSSTTLKIESGYIDFIPIHFNFTLPSYS